MANTSDNDFNTDVIKHWSFRWVSCVALGGLTFTFALLALLSALLTGFPLSGPRSRRAMAMTGRDSLALALLGGQTANLALGLIAVWFGTENLPRFLLSPTCTNLIFMGVASQWNLALSTPVVTLYYALLLTFYQFPPTTTNPEERRNAGAGLERGAIESERPRQGRDSPPDNGGDNDVESRGGGNRRRQESLLQRLICQSCWAGKVGVLTLVGVVNSLTLAVTLASLSAFWVNDREVVNVEGKTGSTFCVRFFVSSEPFPRQIMGGVFMVSAAITAAAVWALSRELERKSKQRHAVGAVDSEDMARLQSFTRPPDEGVHFHHYADPPPGLFRHVDTRALRDVAGSQTDLATLAGGEQTALDLPRNTVSVSSFLTQRNSRGPEVTQERMSVSDSEFYDRERTRHIAQSPPPLAPRARSASYGRSPNLSETTEEGSSDVHMPRLSRFLSTSVESRPSPRWQSLSPNRLTNVNRMINIARNLSDVSQIQSVDWSSEQMQSVNQNAENVELGGMADGSPQHPQPGTSDSTTSYPAAEAGEGVAAEEAELDGIWESLRHLRLADLIFPHRQSEVNPKRFSHTRVKHIREELIPPSPSPSFGRGLAHRLANQPSVLPLPQLIACHSVCASGVLFVLTYIMIAFFLLVTPNGQALGQNQVNYRFIDGTFEPYLSLMLLKASLDSFFCFASLASLPPEQSLF